MMNEAARAIVQNFPDVILAYGDSDEYSFVLRKSCTLFERRESKLVSTFASTFTALYMQFWPAHFPDAQLQLGHLPTFDSRAVLYPSLKSLRDYLSWRQADCHINNLYNTTFWALVLKGGLTPQEAEQKLKGTLASDKNEILFTQFGINYNNEPEIFRKGTVIVRDFQTDAPEQGFTARQLERMRKKGTVQIVLLHQDIIGDSFWDHRPHLLH